MSLQKPTLQTVADLAGVSRSTASVALRNFECVNIKTKQRVQEIAQEIGYVINPFAVGLNQSKQASRSAGVKASIACIVGNSESNYLSPKDLQEGREGAYRLHQTYRTITERAQALGYGVDVFWAYSRQNRGRRLDEILEARGIRGLLFLQVNEEELKLNWDRYVCIYPYKPGLPTSFSFCTENHFKTALTSFEQLRLLGYRKPALVFPQNIQAHELAQSSYGAYFYDHYNNGLNVSEPIPPFFWTRNNDLANLGRWLSRYNPDSLLSHFAYKDKGYCHRLCLELGIRVPEDLGIAYLSTSGLNATGMKESFDEMGRCSVDLLCRKLRYNDYGKSEKPESLVFETKWVEGDTTRWL